VLARIDRHRAAPLRLAHRLAVALDREAGHAHRRGHVDDELRQLRLQRVGAVPRELLAVCRLRAAVLVLARGEIEERRPRAGGAAAALVAVGEIELGDRRRIEPLALL
jgi:hypothetical protein